MKRVGLLGWPVKHSVSPAMFNAAFESLGMDWRYDALPTEPMRLEAVVRGLVGSDLSGVNVTVPHKQAVLRMMDVIDPEARAVGAVNTITVLNTGSLRGSNTDISGFEGDIKPYLAAAREPATRAVVLGAGGAARAAAYVLARLNYPTTIVSRNQTQALELIRDVQVALKSIGFLLNADLDESQPLAGDTNTKWRMQMLAAPWDRLKQLAPRISVLVNCTPLGMWPQVEESPWPDELVIRPGALVYDMVYRPQQTRLLKQAADAGANAVSGLGMLVKQGAAAFTLWTGQEAPVAVMAAAAQAALTADAEV